MQQNIETSEMDVYSLSGHEWSQVKDFKRLHMQNNQTQKLF